ncbi:F0F1 ATP synthase subunit delta [Bacillus sp. AFS055030]|uniref:F0F1 ATP synthase subunit delta n=1 Tax=Bacillus sp. AFS055030 TaxID=2033507 RepID=UPI000BFD6555|nr:F0F1 ATP synthase subunit delta [Bacillus sp. AFS055030]PGL71303.1 F0F1 ATP synthase subunit delta [Bacillus sp. AFS055030]
MSNELVAKRYANALFELATEQNLVGTVEHDLQVVKKEYVGNLELNKFLKHPGITKESKKSVLNDTFASISQTVLNLVCLLVDRGRVNIIPSLVTEYIQIANESRNIADATVYSVEKMSSEELDKIGALFASKLGKNSLRITNEIDSTLIGGYKVRIGNRIYDGTLKNKLVRIERELIAK